MKHIECPMKLVHQFVDFPKPSLLNTNKARNQILFRIYGHFVFGFTQQSPKEYYEKFNIQVEGRLLNRIQEWAEYMRYQKKALPVLNKPDNNENSILLNFFPDDQNIGWVYDDNNISLKFLSTKAIRGISIDRSKNLEKKYYSMIQEKEQIQYKFTAKHVPEAPPSQKFLQHEIEFISNRFLQHEGSPLEGTVKHVLQIETLSGYRWFERMNHYHITDVDNSLDGNPHLIQ